MTNLYILNKKQLNRITKRFTTGKENPDLSIPYLINGNRIMATNASITVLIDVRGLNYTYAPLKEESESTRSSLERLASHFEVSNISTSLTLNRKILQDIVRFLRSTTKIVKTTKTSIEFTESGALILQVVSTNPDESFNETYTVGKADVKTHHHRDSQFIVSVDTSYFTTVLTILRETDDSSILNFTDDARKPMLFTNSTLQTILMPIA